MKAFARAAALAALVSCTRTGQEIPAGKTGVELCIEASIHLPEQSKTAYGYEGGVLKTSWKEGDKLSVISLSGGTIATVNTFTVHEAGTASAKFKGNYTGDADAVKLCVYPALSVESDGVFKSVTVGENSTGYFSAASGSDEIVFAPSHLMRFRQKADADASHIADLDLMSGTLDADLKVTLSKRMSVLRCVFTIPELGEEEKFKTLTLSLDKGQPFTDYAARNSLVSPSGVWTTTHGRSVIRLDFDSFTVSGNTLTAYIPEFPNGSDTSLGGTEARTLSICVKTDSFAYNGTKDIPAGSASAYEFACGKVYGISASLVKDPTPLEGEILGTGTYLPGISTANVVCVDGNVLYAGTGGSILSYDLTSSANPTLLGSVSLKGLPRQMHAENGILYVVSRETGAWIFDVTNPSSPSLIRRYDTVELATGLDVAGGCMFIGERQNGVEFVDVSDNTRPEHIRLLKTPESQSVFYSNGYLYSGEWGKGQVTIFNASDLSDIRQVKSIDLQGYGDGVWVKGDRLYVSTGHHHRNSAVQEFEGDGHGVEIWDISTPENPSFISRFEFDTFFKSGIDWWFPILSGDGKTLFCSDVQNGVYILDVSDELHPELLAHIKPDNSATTTGMALGNGVLYVADNTNGVKAIVCPRAKAVTKERGTLPVNASARHDYQTYASSAFNAWKPDSRNPVHGAAAYGDALFVACSDAGLNVLKLDGSGKAYKFAQATTGFAGDVQIRGDRLYVAEGLEGLAVYKIGSDLSLTLESRIIDGLSTKSAYRICLWVFTPNDKYVIAGSRYGGYQFLAVDNSGATPTYTWRKQFNSYNAYVRFMGPEVCPGDKLPFYNRYGIYWIDLSSCSSVPTPSANSGITGALADGICPFKDGKAICTQGHKLKVVTVGTATTEKASPENSGFRGAIRWDGEDKVLIANFYDQNTCLVNVTDIENPVVLLQEDLSGKPEPGTFWNGKAVVPCGYQGLMIQK